MVVKALCALLVVVAAGGGVLVSRSDAPTGPGVVLAVVLFPLGVGPEPVVLQRIAAGIVWVAALLAALLSLDRLFHADYEDGELDLLALAPLPLEFALLAKCAANWLEMQPREGRSRETGSRIRRAKRPMGQAGPFGPLELK